jgi:hypothetical protein
MKRSARFPVREPKARFIERSSASFFMRRRRASLKKPRLHEVFSVFYGRFGYEIDRLTHRKALQQRFDAFFRRFYTNFVSIRTIYRFFYLV